MLLLMRKVLLLFVDVSACDSHKAEPSLKRPHEEGTNEISSSNKRPRVIKPKTRSMSIKEAVLQQKQLFQSLPVEIAAETTHTSRGDPIKYVELDCEIVGTGAYGKRSVLARACVVDYSGIFYMMLL